MQVGAEQTNPLGTSLSARARWHCHLIIIEHDSTQLALVGAFSFADLIDKLAAFKSLLPEGRGEAPYASALSTSPSVQWCF